MTRARELADLLTGNQTITTDDNSANLTLTSTDADGGRGPDLVLTRDSASPADGDAIGFISWTADNDAGAEHAFCGIEVLASDVSDGSEDATWSLMTQVAGTSRSRLSATPTETVFNEDSIDSDFRVESDGNAYALFVDAGNNCVSIGNSIPGSFNSGANNLVVGTGSGSEGITIYGGNESNIFFADGTDTADNLRGRIEYSHLSEGMLFYVNNTYAGRIDSDTSLLLGTSSKGGSEKLALIGGPAFNMAHASTGTVGVFRTSGISGSIVGSISVSGSATAFNTSSDYRLKQNVQDMTGAIDRVKQLAPKRFNFIADADTTVDGFLAHEAQAIVPEAISGTKDETREVNNAVLSSDGRLLGEDITQAEWTAGKQATEKDGETIPAIYPSDSTWSASHTEPVMQGIDQSKLVPLLTAALKESIAKIEALEARVTALEDA